MNSPIYASTRELKNKTNELLRFAASGKKIIVTRYGKPVATLKPFEADDLIEQNLSLYEQLKNSIGADSSGLAALSCEELRELNDQLSQKVTGFATWQQMDRAAKGDRYDISR